MPFPYIIVFRYNDQQLIIIHNISYYYNYNTHDVVLLDAHDQCSVYLKQINQQPETHNVLPWSSCVFILPIRLR